MTFFYRLKYLFTKSYHWIAIAIFLLSYFYFEVLYQLSEKGQAIGNVSSLRGKTEILVDYKVKGKEFRETEKVGMLAKYIKVGEKYLVIYNLDNPESARIKFVRPLITEDSLFALTTSSKCELIGILGDKYLKYSFSVNDITYERVQAAENIQFVDGSYRVVYNKFDPLVSYICYDSINCWSKFHTR
jgi:hypothetical protein